LSTNVWYDGWQVDRLWPKYLERVGSDGFGQGQPDLAEDADRGALRRGALRVDRHRVAGTGRIDGDDGPIVAVAAHPGDPDDVVPTQLRQDDGLAGGVPRSVAAAVRTMPA
jgi:hypothetical protein